MTKYNNMIYFHHRCALPFHLLSFCHKPSFSSTLFLLTQKAIIAVSLLLFLSLSLSYIYIYIGLTLGSLRVPLVWFRRFLLLSLLRRTASIQNMLQDFCIEDIMSLAISSTFLLHLFGNSRVRFHRPLHLLSNIADREEQLFPFSVLNILCMIGGTFCDHTNNAFFTCHSLCPSAFIALEHGRVLPEVQ